MKWNTEETKKAIELHKLGKRFEEIALILNRTTRSIDLKLKRNGLYANKKNTDETIICKNCGKYFISKIKDKRKFCSSSCSAEFNNKNRMRVKKLKFCLNCNKQLNSHQYKFCSNICSGKFQTKLIFEKIENGDETLHFNAYKRYLIEKNGEKCMKCGWNEKHPITGNAPIQLEHIDGNSDNNKLDNLLLLCPNCHSLTLTFGALNKGNGREQRRIKRNEKK